MRMCPVHPELASDMDKERTMQRNMSVANAGLRLTSTCHVSSRGSALMLSTSLSLPAELTQCSTADAKSGSVLSAWTTSSKVPRPRSSWRTYG